MEKSQNPRNLLGKIRTLFAPEEKLAASPLVQSTALSPSKPIIRQTEREFWKPTITGQLRPDGQELVIYFNVLRSESRAYKTQQMIQHAGGNAEVLRLVGWELDQPHVTIEVNATDTGSWECQQREAAGKREPYGYVVMSSIFGIGLTNSLTIPYVQLKNRSLCFQLDDQSQWTRVVN
jgi:hypothetical protein